MDFIRFADHTCSIAIPLNARLLADLFYLDLNTTENPNGSMDIPQFYKALLDIRIWGVNNNDPGIAWNRRRWASEAAQAITSSARELVRSVAADKASLGLFGIVTSLFTATRRTAVKEGSLRWCGKQIVEKLLAAGKSVEDVADILWLTAFGGIGVPVTYASRSPDLDRRIRAYGCIVRRDIAVLS